MYDSDYHERKEKRVIPSNGITRLLYYPCFVDHALAYMIPSALPIKVTDRFYNTNNTKWIVLFSVTENGLKWITG